MLGRGLPGYCYKFDPKIADGFVAMLKEEEPSL